MIKKKQSCSCQVVKTSSSIYFNSSNTKGDDAINFYSGAVSDITIGRIKLSSRILHALSYSMKDGRSDAERSIGHNDASASFKQPYFFIA